MPRPCAVAHVLSPASCHLCRLAVTDPEYALLWGESERAPAARCRHLGADTGHPLACDCPGQPPVSVHRCALHVLCTVDCPVKRQGVTIPWCEDCRRGGKGYAPAPAPPVSWQWISTARLLRDAITLAGMLPDTCAGVVGIPRSGLIPAAVMATSLHLPLWTLEGRTLRPCHVPASRGGSLPARGGPLAVVDDTTFTGDAMRRVRAALGSRPAVYCAVYVNSLRPASRAAVDLFACELPAPHLLEWNWSNNGPMAGLWADVPAYGNGMALDLDGVIVHDAHSGGKPGSPYMVPRAHPCRLICTGAVGVGSGGDGGRSAATTSACGWLRLGDAARLASRMPTTSGVIAAAQGAALRGIGLRPVRGVGTRAGRGDSPADRPAGGLSACGAGVAPLGLTHLPGTGCRG